MYLKYQVNNTFLGEKKKSDELVKIKEMKDFTY